MRIGTLAGGFGLGCVVAALAGEATAGDWIVTVGLRPQAATPYEGADHDVVLPVPSIALRRPGQPDRLVPPDDGYGVSAFSWNWINVGPAVRLRGSRDDEGARAGLSPVGIAVETGVFFSLWPTDWLRLHAEERKGVTGHHGWIGDADIDLVASEGPWTASIGPRIGWGDRSYMQTYFGVTPAEAAANAAIDTPYTPGGGIRYLGATGTLTYRFSERWQTNANVGFHHLAAPPADSPIVQTLGARTEVYGGLGLKYSFSWKR